tara:strand:+ start:1189 stop:1386 length:198 start_codon:yes stop_codon:yes gene_type:complete
MTTEQLAAIIKKAALVHDFTQVGGVALKGDIERGKDWVKIDYADGQSFVITIAPTLTSTTAHNKN